MQPGFFVKAPQVYRSPASKSSKVQLRAAKLKHSILVKRPDSLPFTVYGRSARKALQTTAAKPSQSSNQVYKGGAQKHLVHFSSA